MASTFATTQDVLDAASTEARFFVFVNRILTPAFSYNGQHGTDQAVATARLTLDLPRPGYLTPNAPVEVQAGWDNRVGTIFSGRIPARTAAFDETDATLTIQCVGWASLLAYPDRFDLVYPGPITLRDLFLSLCARRRIPSYAADDVTSPDGTVAITLGGNPAIDEGRVVIPAGTSPLTFLNTAAELYGYRVYDTPAGTVRLSRVSGTPVGTPVATFAEGRHLERASRDYDVSDMVTYHDVRGESYEDSAGALVPIRSIPAVVPAVDYLPEGYTYRKTDSSLIVTQAQADIVRQRLEIDTSLPQAPLAWTAVGLPGLSPGDVVAVESDTIEAPAGLTYWLTDIDLTYDADDFSGRYRGWAGGGQPLPQGVDRQEIVLQAAPRHIGDEVVPWYAQPSPAGRELSWTVTIPERATAVNIRGMHHGSNSQLIDGAAADDLTVSRWELWRPGEDKAESSGNIPAVPENYTQQLPYATYLSLWTPFAVNLRGTEAGTVTIKLIAGDNAGIDDLEVRDVVLEYFGVADPIILPSEVS